MSLISLQDSKKIAIIPCYAAFLWFSRSAIFDARPPGLDRGIHSLGGFDTGPLKEYEIIQKDPGAFKMPLARPRNTQELMTGPSLILVEVRYLVIWIVARRMSKLGADDRFSHQDVQTNERFIRPISIQVELDLTHRGPLAD